MKISGNIKDSFGNLSGAEIILTRDKKRTNLGVVTNSEGDFELENDDIKTDDIFEIRYLGLVSQFKKAKDLQDVEILMKKDVEELDEVIVNANLGNKPKEVKIKNWQQKWYTSPTFILGTIALITSGVIVYIIKKTK